MDGPTTLRKMRAVAGLEDVLAVFLTAENNPERLAERRAAGAAKVLSKPIEAQRVTEQLQAVFARVQESG